MTTPQLPRGNIKVATSWLWKLLAEREAEGLTLTAEPDFVVQLYDVYKNSTISAQESFKSVVARAVHEWQFPARSYDNLRDLLFFAARIRASEVALPLCRLVKRKRLWDNSLEPPALEACGAAVAMLAGFLPNVEAEVVRTLSTIYFDAEVHSHLGAVLFNALCRSHPEEYPRFLGRYCELREQDPEFFDDAWVFGTFVESVHAEIVAGQFERLGREEKDFLLRQLRRPALAPVGLILDFRSGTIRLQDDTGKPFDLEEATGEMSYWKMLNLCGEDDFLGRIDLLLGLEKSRNGVAP